MEPFIYNHSEILFNDSKSLLFKGKQLKNEMILQKRILKIKTSFNINFLAFVHEESKGILMWLEILGFANIHLDQTPSNYKLGSSDRLRDMSKVM